MKDFDLDRAIRETADRSFRLGGETFTFRPYVHPNVMIRFQESFGQGDATFLERLDEIMTKDLLDPGQESKWKKIRSDKLDKPVSSFDLVAVYNYIIGEATGRPTVQSSDSSATPSPTGTDSTAPSRSKALTSVA